MSRRRFETRAIHAGQEPDPATGAVVPPISLSTTFAQDAVGEHRGYEYAAQRQPDPRRARDVRRVARGRAARPRVRERAGGRGRDPAHARSRRPRDHPDRRVRRHVPARRARARAARARVDGGRPPRPGRARGGVARRDRASCGSSRRRTRCSRSSTSRRWPSSRTRAARASSSTTRSRRRSSSSRSRSAPTSSVHSSTKYLGGHSDVVGGFVAVDDAELADEVRFLQNAIGAVPSPFDCYLVLRGVKTLAVRMERHCDNARADRARCCARTTRSPACSIPGSPSIPATTSRPARCATSAAWCRSSPPAARTPRSTSWRARACSRSPSRSARSSR